MHLSAIFLSSWYAAITSGSVFSKSGIGVTDITVYTSIPAATTEIWFYNNAVVYVPAGFFVSLPSLDKIWLHKNQILDVADGAFSGVPTVTRIGLSGCISNIVF